MRISNSIRLPGSTPTNGESPRGPPKNPPDGKTAHGSASSFTGSIPSSSASTVIGRRTTPDCPGADSIIFGYTQGWNQGPSFFRAPQHMIYGFLSTPIGEASGSIHGFALAQLPNEASGSTPDSAGFCGKSVPLKVSV